MLARRSTEPLGLARTALAAAGPATTLETHRAHLALGPDAGQVAPLPDNARLLRAITSRATVNQAKLAAAMRDLGDLPAENEILHLVLSRSFQMWQMVPAILNKIGATCVEAYFATLSINVHNVRQLLALFDAGQIRRIHFALSSVFPAKNEHIWRDLTAGLTARHQPHGIALVHAKVTGLKFATGQTFVIEGSGNLRNCSSIEQFIISAGADVYEFHRQWVTELTARGARPKPSQHQ